MLVIFEHFSDCPEDLLNRAFFVLPSWRQQQLLRRRMDSDRRLGTLAYLLLLYALRTSYQIYGLPRFSEQPNGKPFLPDYPQLHFSLSHCRIGAACVLENKPVGLDMQEIRPASPRLIRRVCSPGEQRLIQTADYPDAVFTRLWAQKESYVKLTGEGVCSGLRNLDEAEIGRRCHMQVSLKDKYALAYCSYV